MESTVHSTRALLILGCIAFASACSSEQQRAAPSNPTEPGIQSLESTSETVHPGDSVQLAVVAGPVSELDDSGSSDAGSTSTGSQALSHDAGTSSDAAGSGARDASVEDTGPAIDDTGTFSDATSTARDGSTATIPDDTGADDRSDTDGSGNEDASSGSTPEPPSGNVPEGWSVEWSATGDGWSITGDGATATLTAPDRYEATATVTVTVSTPEGRSTSAETTVTTGSNTAPAIVNSTTRPNPVAPGNTVEATIEAADPNGDELTYQWRIADPWTIESTSGGEATIRAPDRDGVFADLRVEVRDGYDGRTSSSIRLETRTNTPPNLASVTASPPQVAPEGTIQLEASATDVEDDQLDYTWSVPSDWSADATEGASIEVTAPDQYGATATVRVTVEDSRGVTATGRVVVSTESNRGPSIASLDANPKSVSKGGTIDFEVTASDPNGDPLSYNWSVQDSQNWSLSSQGSGATLQAPDQPGESTNVEVTVTDESGASARASMVVSTEANRAPTIASLSANPPEIDPRQTTRLLANAADPDGDSLTYKWSTPSGWSEQNSSGTPPNALVLQAPSTYDDRQVVTLTVEDGFGGSAQATAVVLTESNRRPILSALTANPQATSPGGSIRVEATASDPNGDSLSYDWTVPQGWSQSGSGASIDVTAPGSYGEQGLVRVSVKDGSGGTANGSVLVRTDRNQSPIISNVTANPVVVNPGGTSTIQVNASDPNGDALSYSWNMPQGWSKKGSGDQIDVVAPNKTSVSATITVTVSDGQGGSSQSAVVLQTINNRPPTIQSLNANPDKVPPTKTIQIQAQVNDPEGDSIQYNWNVPSGWSKQGSGASIQVVAPDEYAQTDSVKLIASDGRAQTSDSVLVQTVDNAAPTVDDLSADPNPVLQNAETTVEVKASDPYGDSLSYSWNVANGDWTRSGNGSQITLEAPNQSNSSTLVEVTVDDNNGETTNASTTVKLKSCPSNKGNCDGKASNGCEIDLNSNDNNCGACGKSCTGGKQCSQGKCVSFPSQCQTGQGPQYGDTYVVCRADATSAWVSHKGGGEYNARRICSELGYNRVTDWGGTCGNVCGYCEGGTSCNNPGKNTFDGSGGSPNSLSTVVQWRCAM